MKPLFIILIRSEKQFKQAAHLFVNFRTKLKVFISYTRQIEPSFALTPIVLKHDMYN